MLVARRGALVFEVAWQGSKVNNTLELYFSLADLEVSRGHDFYQPENSRPEKELVQICEPITMSIRFISSPEKIGLEKNMTK